jgi:hypothetical protein
VASGASIKPGEHATAGMVASSASIKPGEPGEALHREARAARCGRRAAPLDVPWRCARTDAGGALATPATAGMVASSASIKPGEPGEALHRDNIPSSRLTQVRRPAIIRDPCNEPVCNPALPCNPACSSLLFA